MRNLEGGTGSVYGSREVAKNREKRRCAGVAKAGSGCLKEGLLTCYLDLVKRTDFFLLTKLTLQEQFMVKIYNKS